jgi:hypothetical protein
MIDGLVIDSTDIKFLPRYECQQPDTKIWKIAMWGSQQDFIFLKKLINNNTLSSDKRLIFGKGLCCDSEKPDFLPDTITQTKAIRRYYINDGAVTNKKYYRKDENIDTLFTTPFIVVKEMQHNRQIASALIDYVSFFTTGTYIINGNNVPLYIKQILVSFFNSDITRYILFLISSSWGIERERVCLLNELSELPIVYKRDIENKSIKRCFNNIVCQLKSDFPNPQIISDNEYTILKELYKALNISTKEQILIEDTLKFSLDLFEQGENSIGFKQTLPEENTSYA